jgi:hypothetical protein
MNRPLMNPVTSELLAKVSKGATQSVSIDDAIAIVRMVRNGDLVHVDAIPAWLEAQEQAILRDEMVDAFRTPEAIYDDAAYARGRGGV